MKRLLLALLITGLLATNAFAVGTIIGSYSTISIDGKSQRILVTLTCTADAAAGTYPTFTINPLSYGIKGYYLYSVETNPGAVQPTDNYDITITDAGGYDVTGGLLANRDTLNTELVYLGSVGYPMITGNWTWTISNNVVNSAVVVATLTFIMN